MNKEDFEKVREIFKDFDYQVIVSSVIDGSEFGRIWVDDVEYPTCAFMASSEGYFLAGNPDNNAFNNALRDMILEIISSRKAFIPDLDYLFFYISPDNWQSKFQTIFPTRFPVETKRFHFICDSLKLDWKENLPEGFAIHRVDKNLDLETLVLTGDVKEWIRDSLDDYLDKGFGACMSHGNTVVAWSTADCASGQECEIGIFTSEKYRRQGLGVLTAAAAVDFCFSSNFTKVGWHCEGHNYGSIAVAEKVGFRKEREYIMFICMFDEAAHQEEIAMRLE